MPHQKTFSGQRVGEYEITGRIGEGGMGIVYEGRHPIIGKRVAVKVLRSNLSSDQHYLERFVAEARAVNEIRHRGIVDIFGFGQLDDGSHYFVMEYLEGTPFDRIMKDRGQLQPIEVLGWAEQICGALHAAHEANVVHRDIKPSNLFLVDTGREAAYVKLLDFGIAKLMVAGPSNPLTQAGLAVGTPDYMAPEQARGLPITPAVDIYALGCLMFEMLTGQHVFIGGTDVETILMHIQEEPPHLLDIRRDLPQQLDELIWWMMRKVPGERPRSAELLGKACASLRGKIEGGDLKPSRPSQQRFPQLSAEPPTRPSRPSLAEPVRNLSTPAPQSTRQSHSSLPRIVGAPTKSLNTPAPPMKSSATDEIAFALQEEISSLEEQDKTKIYDKKAETSAAVRARAAAIAPKDAAPSRGPSPKRVAVIAALVTIGVGSLVLGALKLAKPKPAPAAVPVQPAVVPEVAPAPPAPEVVAPKEPAAVVPGKKAPVKKGPRKVTPAGTVVSRDALFQRAFFLEKRLAVVGDPDGAQLAKLNEARTAARKASTNDERLQVARMLDDVESELPAP